MPTPKRKIFYSFHFDNDVMRVQQIRNMGVIEGNAPVAPNTWETARKTPGGIERWINENMNNTSCVVVLVGSETASRPWVDYEIRKAWTDGKGIVGINIHNLKDPRTSSTSPFFGKSAQGANPFDQIKFTDGTSLSKRVTCYNPSASDTYNDIESKLSKLVEDAIAARSAK